MLYCHVSASSYKSATISIGEKPIWLVSYATDSYKSAIVLISEESI